MEKFAGTNDPFLLSMHNLRAKRLISANLHTHTQTHTPCGPCKTVHSHSNECNQNMPDECIVVKTAWLSLTAAAAAASASNVIICIMFLSFLA